MFFAITLGFLIGSIPFGKHAGTMRGVDIQKEGSGNIGFANVFRVLGWQWAISVLIGDLLKGYLPAAYALHSLSLTQTLWVGMATLAGSIFNPWLGWTGGKGVAVLLGISFALDPRIGLAGITTWLIIVAVFRASSLGSLTATLVILLFSVGLQPNIVWFYALSFVIVLLKHRTNIDQLASGHEAKLFGIQRNRP